MNISGSMLSLPLEVVEDVIVFLAIDDQITTISSLAQTCRRLRQFIYDPTDRHLWHRVFLTTFDDPHIGFGDHYKHKSSFDWGEETRRRICASIRLRPRPLPVDPDPRILPHRLRSDGRIGASTDHLSDYSLPLRVIHSLIDTVAPLPRSPLPNRGDEDSEESAFAPAMSLVEADAISPLVPPPVQGVWGAQRSRNIFWLYSVLNRGLPFILPCRFAHGRLDKAWLGSEESQALHKIITLFGIQPLMNAHAPGKETKFNWRWKLKDRFQWPRLEDQGRRAFAMRLCEARTFQMSYLKMRRAWGPFLPVENPSKEDRQRDNGEGPSGVVSAGTYDSEEDEDYLPPTARTKVEPPPEKLFPDWVFLAAVRVVMEGCLRMDNVYHDVRAALTSWHALRPGYWAPYPPFKPDPLEAEPSVERDWAGVEGVWQRCVVWLDYDNLITQNDHDFAGDNDSLEEIVLIVPLTMKIVGYSPAAIPGYEHMPTIHIEGEMGGPLWEIEHDQRRIHGTVGVIGDGSIRWSIYSSTIGDRDEDEWVSEGVQIGGIGSRCGVLGLWTGVTHEPQAEPIGAWWQWRVL
ncbi:hypothetical protein BDW22DRAFT_1350363 [Trametopsis cervina]|nr:hypothetical protein BDW22DRAFT_1350363 [Trametopsis cervina]